MLLLYCIVLYERMCNKLGLSVADHRSTRPHILLLILVVVPGFPTESEPIARQALKPDRSYHQAAVVLIVSTAAAAVSAAAGSLCNSDDGRPTNRAMRLVPFVP